MLAPVAGAPMILRRSSLRRARSPGSHRGGHLGRGGRRRPGRSARDGDVPVRRGDLADVLGRFIRGAETPSPPPTPSCA
ncbi:hypothetical protein ACRAWD_15695 [Caulobacter segnis]